MNYWITADTHFGHDMLWKKEYRPVSFESKILANLAMVVKPEDVLIHLGDVCFYNEDAWHARMWNHVLGKKWLIRGNHDKKTTSWYLSHGWDCVADELMLDAFGKFILFTHKPSVGFHSLYDINIHGHLHNAERYPEYADIKNHKLISLEENGYMPQNLRKIIESGR